MKKHQLPVLFAMLLVFFAVLPKSVSAKDEWLQVRSKNFNLIGNASEKDIRKVATKLEQFRETFRLLFNKTNLNSAIPTNVVVFKSDSAYKPFKPKRADGKADNFIAGYFQSGEDVNYITLSTEGEDANTFETIFHEYTHSIINTNFGKSEVPPWFNEGLAEYYSTFAIEEDQKVKLGLLINRHLATLQQTKLIPLETLFKISNSALHQNGDHSRSIFYAESWALIHYLIQSGKAEGLGKFLTLSLKDVSSEKAFQDAFQTTYAQMEKDLKKYVEQNTYKYSLVTLKDKLSFEGEMQSAPLTEAESNAYLGDLLYHTNRADDAEPFLQKALALEPNSSMANTTLGMVKLRQRKFDDAKKYLEKAISQDQRNHLAFYNYAYLLSREDRDEFGYVDAFPAEKSAKMREILKKAIAINPGFTESYELLAFVDLVNHEQLDEAVSYLQKALQYQPGNQRYALRIAEIYLRQDKFAEAQTIADKIAKTADEPEIKSDAEHLLGELRQVQEINDRNEAARKQYESATAGANKNAGQPVLVHLSGSRKPLSPEELAKAEEDAKMIAVNQAIRQAQAGEKQVVGRIQKIECKGKNIAYTIKTNGEVFALSSKDFQSLSLTAFVADAKNAQIGCDANIADFNTVLTYKPQNGDAKNASRGELIAVDFVPKNFRFMTAEDAPTETKTTYAEELPSSPPPQMKSEDFDAQRRASMMQSIKNAMRQPLAGEKRELGFIEKVECSSKGMFFYFKTQAQPFKLFAASPQAIQIRAFTPEVEQLQLGCSMKQVDIPVVFTYKEIANAKNNSNGELLSMEFVPKSFILEK
ncbi:MAG: tetratricopeptide repeat protein [Acidobacteriota bacterium]|nr:tetratricopeptide repeat protein [Acidobacteriota bacterium]